MVVIDPPRKGCDDMFLKQLFAFNPMKVVYVSCDPSTQARDAKSIVAAGYRILDVTPFDLFPQTRHTENVITFLKEINPTFVQVEMTTSVATSNDDSDNISSSINDDVKIQSVEKNDT